MGGAEEAGNEPACGNGGERGEVVFAFDHGKVGQQGEIGAEAGERLQKAAKALAGGVDDAEISLRVVETVSKGSI
jgi:hypothetical protein